MVQPDDKNGGEFHVGWVRFLLPALYGTDAHLFLHLIPVPLGNDHNHIGCAAGDALAR
jgi:hypothetical protein